jgi:hypothetical protein
MQPPQRQQQWKQQHRLGQKQQQEHRGNTTIQQRCRLARWAHSSRMPGVWQACHVQVWQCAAHVMVNMWPESCRLPGLCNCI